jgi:hypothetical protein
MTVLLAEGVLRAWVFPDQLAFIQTSLCVACVAELAPSESTSQGPPRALAMAPGPTASANVAPQPLDL